MATDSSTEAACETCGNLYDRAFMITTADGRTLTFDSFECAIHRLAPRCAHCACVIIGHGVADTREVFCCTHCQRQAHPGPVR